MSARLSSESHLLMEPVSTRRIILGSEFQLERDGSSLYQLGGRARVVSSYNTSAGGL